jgi:hypothetical protein
MDGVDEAGLGGIHKLHFRDPWLVYASPPPEGNTASEVLTTSNFEFLRRFGIAIFGGTETGGQVSVHLYIYPAYDYRFVCDVGLPPNSPALGSALSGFEVQVGQGEIQPSPHGLAAIAVSGIGDPPSKLSGIVELRWDIPPVASPGAVDIKIWQQKATAWSFHVCSVSRQKA